MSRPGFVLEADASTPPLMTMSGSQLKLERIGVGTKVVYPADAVASTGSVGLIESALSAPIGGDALASRLQADTTLTIVVEDCDWPLPRPEFDIRRALVESVLETAARVGVDDVQIVIANGLKQRWSATQVTTVLGDRVASSFLPDGLVTSHDVTGDDLVTLGEIDGHAVRFNKRVAESDLVVVVGVRADYTTGCPLVTGLSDVSTINRLRGVHRDEAFADQVGELTKSALSVFSLVAVLGQPLLGRNLRFVGKREWEWSLAYRLALVTARQVVAALPRQGARFLHGNPLADYAVVDVLGGDHGEVLKHSRQVWQAANAVEVNGQADVLVASVWGASVDEGDPIGSPLSAAHHALVRQAGTHMGKPYTREGGVLIAFHPLVHRFANRRHSAAADFYAKVLSETIDPAEIAEGHEPAAIADEWYLDLYRKQFAHHPLRVFHEWYATADAARHFSNVIWVGGDRRTAAVLGHRAATTFADALEIASNAVGQAPEITYLRGPGLALGDVR